MGWEDWLFRGFLALCGALIAGLVVLIGFLVWDAFQPPPPSFSLVTADWSCSADHRETYTSMLLVGKVFVPRTHTRTVCDQWSRRA